mmetsp:Transcript_81402/g.226734  ORF Transcript_81402/g.226734 Transcript_81402/m.226734 type:complete len:706 (+) Transcript_81402:75-2192(+)
MQRSRKRCHTIAALSAVSDSSPESSSSVRPNRYRGVMRQLSATMPDERPPCQASGDVHEIKRRPNKFRTMTGQATRSLAQTTSLPNLPEITDRVFPPISDCDSDSLDGLNLKAETKPKSHISWLRAKGGVLVSSAWFQGAIASLIILNAVCIGFETDVHDPKWIRVTDAFENIMLTAFAMELILRIVVHSNFFGFYNSELVWNLFDTVLVTIGVIDFAISQVLSFRGGHNDSSHNSIATVFRIFRILRIMRVFRIIRFLRQLYVLSYGFFLAFEAVFWVSMLLAVALYTCSIVLTRTVGRGNEEGELDAEFWHKRYGTVRSSMLTLFELVMQPNLTDYRLQLPSKPIYACFFVCFVIFGSFGMLAVLTGVMSESMAHKNQLKLVEERQEREVARNYFSVACQELVDGALVDGLGQVKREDLIPLLPRLRALFEIMNISYTLHDLEDMLRVMDVDGSGSVDRAEFCRGLLHIAENSGDVKPMLTMELHYTQLGYLKKRMVEFEAKVMEVCERQHAATMEALKNRLAALEVCLSKASQQEREVTAALEVQAEDVVHYARRFNAIVMAKANLHEVLNDFGRPSNAEEKEMQKKLSTIVQPPAPSPPYRVDEACNDPLVLVQMMQAQFGIMQGDFFALAGKFEDIVGNMRGENVLTRTQALSARQHCQYLKKVVEPRVSLVEAEVRKMRESIAELTCQLRPHYGRVTIH